MHSPLSSHMDALACKAIAVKSMEDCPKGIFIREHTEADMNEIPIPTGS